MAYQPIARIILRYGLGALAGWTVGDLAAGDPDLVDAVAAGLSVAGLALTEWWYARAKRAGGPT